MICKTCGCRVETTPRFTVKNSKITDVFSYCPNCKRKGNWTVSKNSGQVAYYMRNADFEFNLTDSMKYERLSGCWYMNGAKIPDSLNSDLLEKTVYARIAHILYNIETKGKFPNGEVNKLGIDTFLKLNKKQLRKIGSNTYKFRGMIFER